MALQYSSMDVPNGQYTNSRSLTQPSVPVGAPRTTRTSDWAVRPFDILSAGSLSASGSGSNDSSNSNSSNNRGSTSTSMLTFSKPDAASLLTDDWHCAFTGSRSVPLMLSAASQRLRFMPYGLAGQVGNDAFYVYNVSSKASSSTVSRGKEKTSYVFGGTSAKSLPWYRPYYLYRGLRLGVTVYTDNDVLTVASWPCCLVNSQQAAVGRRTTRPRLLTHASLVIKTLSADRALELRKDSPNYLSFQVSYDAYVYVCVDSRLSRPPQWAIFLGFRLQENQLVLTNDPTVSFSVYRRLYREAETVHLGDNICHASR